MEEKKYFRNGKEYRPQPRSRDFINMQRSGFLHKMKLTREEYLNEMPSEGYVYNKYIGVNENHAHQMVKEYKQVLQDFDILFNYGEYSKLLSSKFGAYK